MNQPHQKLYLINKHELTSTVNKHICLVYNMNKEKHEFKTQPTTLSFIKEADMSELEQPCF